LRRVSEKLESREGELAEALEQQTATSEILRVIASSPTDIQPVLDAVIESAARLCDATDGLIARIDGDVLLPAVAKYGSMPVPEARRLSYGTPVGRAIIDRETVHVHDSNQKSKLSFRTPSLDRQSQACAPCLPPRCSLKEGLSVQS
jgi:two-component system, NtrC family, sensor kinase